MKKYTREEIKEGSKYVDASEIVLNDWNPKAKRTDEYYKVKDSLEKNGQVMPVVVRNCKDGVHKYEVLDGEQRFTALLELGEERVWIVNLGDVKDEEAKALTIWMEQAVPFDDNLLGELLIELQDEVELPYTDEEISLIAGTFPETDEEGGDGDGEEKDKSLFAKYGLVVARKDLDEIKEMHNVLSVSLLNVPEGIGNDVLSYSIIKLATYPDSRDLLQQIIETKVKENNMEQEDENDDSEGD